jgi:hypothetical protein
LSCSTRLAIAIVNAQQEGVVSSKCLQSHIVHSTSRLSVPILQDDEAVYVATWLLALCAISTWNTQRTFGMYLPSHAYVAYRGRCARSPPRDSLHSSIVRALQP